MKRKFIKRLVTVCALTFHVFFALPAVAGGQQSARYFWVYRCRAGEFQYFEYKSPKGSASARKLCEKHARHEKKYKNADCLSCAQVTTADGKTPEPNENS